MLLKTFDELTFSKIAFLANYTNVYHNDYGHQKEIASPGKWVTDRTAINEFAFDFDVELEQTETGDLYHVTEESGNAVKGNFLEVFRAEIQRAENALVDELLEEKREELKKQAAYK